jgi:hypothetical protein
MLTSLVSILSSDVTSLNTTNTTLSTIVGSIPLSGERLQPLQTDPLGTLTGYLSGDTYRYFGNLVYGLSAVNTTTILASAGTLKFTIAGAGGNECVVFGKILSGTYNPTTNGAVFTVGFDNPNFSNTVLTLSSCTNRIALNPGVSAYIDVAYRKAPVLIPFNSDTLRFTTVSNFNRLLNLMG